MGHEHFEYRHEKRIAQDLHLFHWSGGQGKKREGKERKDIFLCVIDLALWRGALRCFFVYRWRDRSMGMV
jgi:hypothetical protein